MGRYYFHVRNGAGALAEDPDGDELTDIEAVRAHALDVARDLIARTRLDGVHNWFDCTFEIMDAAGKPALRVPFTDAVADADVGTDDEF